jgi:HEAT repeat protein
MNSNPNRGSSRKEKPMNDITKTTSVAVLVTLGLTLGARAAELPPAAQVLKATGVDAGLAVVVGSTDGALEAALTRGQGQWVSFHDTQVDPWHKRYADQPPAEGGRLLVQGLALSEDAAAKARRHIFEQKLYGLASVSRVKTAATLPYYDRLVNLLVADLGALGNDAPPREEINRVLGYGGVAYLKRDGRWATAVKAAPKDVDTWTNVRGTAARNSTCEDQVVAPPNAIRWITYPFAQGAFGAGARTSDGTSVHMGAAFEPHSSRAFANMPNSRQLKRQGANEVGLFARDVNSGVPLWNRVISTDIPWGRPVQIGLSETFVAAKGRVYALDFNDEQQVALKAWNIRTGVLEKVFDKGGVIRKDAVPEMKDERQRARDWRVHAQEVFDGTTVMVEDGKVFQALRDRIVAMDAASGAVIWSKPVPNGNQCVRAFISGGRLIALIGKQMENRPTFIERTAGIPLVALQCWQAADGKDLWQHAFGDELKFPWGGNANWSAFGCREPYLVLPYEGDKSAGGRGVMLVDLRSGKPVWDKRSIGMPMWTWSIIGDTLWSARGHWGGARDLLTGDAQRVAGGPNPGACSLSSGTPNWFIHKRIFVPTNQKDPDRSNRWWCYRGLGTRCVTTPAPSYGSVHGYPTLCSCETFVPGCNSLYAVAPVRAVPDANRLVKAAPAAMGPVVQQTEAQSSPAAFVWGNPAHINALFMTNYQRGAKFLAIWQGYGLRQTPPVQAGDLTLVAHVHEHRLAASRGGKEVWNFIADGRIGSPPVVHGDLAIFGSHDGSVYAVALKDGSLAWRFLAAPADKRHVVLGQVESAWPVFGVVLDRGNLYFSAGRQDAVDGGIHFYCLDPATGAMAWRVKHQRGIESDRTPIRNRASLNAKKDELGATDGRAVTNDVLEIRDGKLCISGLPMVDLADPKDTVLDPETITPPGIKEQTSAADIPALIGSLADRDLGARVNAARRLGLLGPQARDAVKPLARALADENGAMRRTAAESLRRIGVLEPVLDELRKALYDPESRVREAAATALGAAGKAALPRLIRVLQSADLSVVCTATRAVSDGDIPAECSCPCATACAAAQAIADLGPEASAAAVPDLVRALKAEAAHSQRLYGHMPSSIRDSRLRRAIERSQVVRALGVAGEPAAPALASCLDGADDPVLRYAMSSLLGLGPKARSALPAVLKLFRESTDTYSKSSAALALAAMAPDSDEVIAALAAGLKGEDATVRRSCANALASLGTKGRKALEEAARNPDPAIAGAAADPLKTSRP